MPPVGSRRQARTLALQALFEADLSSHPALDALARGATAKPEADTTVAFAQELVAGVAAHHAAIDAVLAQSAPQFPLEDMAPIDRNILRLAIFEMLHDEVTPIAVAASEAVALAETFGTESSSRFVNGVLGTVAGYAARRH